MSAAYLMHIADRIRELDYKDEPKLTNVSTDWGGRLSPAVGFAGYPSGYVPHMYGGGRMRDTIIPGAQAAGYPAVNMLKAADQTGASWPEMDLELDPAMPSQVMSGNGKLKARKRVKKVVEKVAKEVAERVDAAEAAPIDMKVGEGMVGGVNRLKKATRWTNYVADTAERGIDLAKQAAPLLLAGEAPKKVSARAAIVKQIMAEKGLGMICASKYVKEHGLYKKA